MSKEEMPNNLYDYVIYKTNKGEEVKIKIKRVRRQYEGIALDELDWIIDDKYIIEDMPSEVFEGEELTELSKENLK